MSTRAEGARAPIIQVTAKATITAGAASFKLMVTEESAGLWRYTLSTLLEPRNSCVGYGKVIVPGHLAALRRAAQICAGGYQPGTTEHGLLDAFAQDAL